MNFKDRVFLSDVFGDYIPSFHYLVVPLNKYSKQDLIEKNDELSLIFLINQLQNSSEFHALKDIPKEYTEHLTENTPDYLLKIIGKVIAVLLHKLNIPDEEVYEVTDQITRRKFSIFRLTMFKRRGESVAKKDGLRDESKANVPVESKANVPVESKANNFI